MKIFPISLGCVKNQVDLEYLMAKLVSSGFEIADREEESDCVLVNTCSFIADARNESEQAIRMRLKTGRLIVTGCYPQLDGRAFKRKFKGVMWTLGTEPQRESARLASALKNKRELFSLNPNGGSYSECRKRITFNRFHTYIKLSEGCSRKCAYCSIPAIRGRLRSRKKMNIMNEVSALSKLGFREFNLISEDSSMYGRDIYKNYGLPELISDLSSSFQSLYFRVLYAFPDKNIYRVIDSIAESENFIRYIDVPFQHSSGSLLPKMGRHGEDPRRVSAYARERGMIVRSSVMVGFPGETKSDADDLVDFVERGGVDKLGVFIYSDEKGTPAFSMKGKVSEKEKAERFNSVIKAYGRFAKRMMRMNVGKRKKAVFYGYERGFSVGRLLDDAPSVDSILYAKGRMKLNEIKPVTVKGVRNYSYIV